MCTPIRITNVVCTANFNTSIYLPRFVASYPWLEWNRKKFAAATMRFTDPKTTCKSQHKQINTSSLTLLSLRRLGIWEWANCMYRSQYINSSQGFSYASPHARARIWVQREDKRLAGTEHCRSIRVRTAPTIRQAVRNISERDYVLSGIISSIDL